MCIHLNGFCFAVAFHEWNWFEHFVLIGFRIWAVSWDLFTYTCNLMLYKHPINSSLLMQLLVSIRIWTSTIFFPRKLLLAGICSCFTACSSTELRGCDLISPLLQSYMHGVCTFRKHFRHLKQRRQWYKVVYPPYEVSARETADRSF